MSRRGRPVTNDDDLVQKSKRDDFWIRRIFRYALLVCAVIILTVITAVLCYALIQNAAFRNTVLDNVKNNMVGIILGVAAILGVNLKIGNKS